MTNENAIEDALKPQKAWIDAASYEMLLRRWRFAPVGDPMFAGEIGNYYEEVMMRKKAETGDNGVSASKAIGWDKP